MFTQIRILPMIIALASVVFIFRVGDIVNGVDGLFDEAVAQEAETAAGQTAQSAAAQATQNASDQETDPLLMSRSELDLLQDLAVRREALNARESELSVREHLLEATESQIDAKIAQLQSLEARISTLVQSYEQQENAEMASLVKIYETMKPKDAAAIFSLLDMPVQIDVATRMKEAKMAPILSNMTPEAARALTIELATRAALPQIDG